MSSWLGSAAMAELPSFIDQTSHLVQGRLKELRNTDNDTGRKRNSAE